MGVRVFSGGAVGCRSFERVNERSVGGFLAGLHTLVLLCGQQSLKHHSHSRLPPVHAWSTRWRSQGMEKREKNTLPLLSIFVMLMKLSSSLS